MKKILLLLFSLITINIYSTTWDEPWQKEIIEQSEFFILGEVLNASDTLVNVKITKSIGKELKGEIKIDGFFMLNLCSVSGGHGPKFFFEKGEKGYFFLKKGNNGNYQIPTPTSGFDRISDSGVHATFRHTYHQASIKQNIYENTYKIIWNKYHDLEYDLTDLNNFINEYLSKTPAGFEEDEIQIFFNQHLALESLFLLGIEKEFNLLEKFAIDDNFHSRISAIRAMQYVNNKEVLDFLIKYIKDEKRDNFTKVIAIWVLKAKGDENSIEEIFKIKDSLSSEDTGFGGNIMDPRVCTRFPSPKLAATNIKNNG